MDLHFVAIGLTEPGFDPLHRDKKTPKISRIAPKIELIYNKISIFSSLIWMRRSIPSDNDGFSRTFVYL